MERYAPTIKDLAPRDIVARCMVQEVAEGRGAGPHKDYVLLDCTHLGAEVLETKLPDITEFARTYLGVDPVVEPVPVMPTAHYAMGGIPTKQQRRRKERSDTIVPGLYAAGECACVSVHGANRLGTNSLLDINVFGKRSGRNAVEYVKTAEFVPLPENPAGFVSGMLEDLRNNQGTERIAVLRKTLQDEMDKGAQVFRTHDSLQHVLGVIAELRERYKNVHVDDKASGSTPICSRPSSWASFSTSPRSWSTPRRTARRAAGGHMRDDFPTRDDEKYMKHTMAYLTGDPHSSTPSDHIKLDWKPVVFTKNDQGELNYPPMERKY